MPKGTEGRRVVYRGDFFSLLYRGLRLVSLAEFRRQSVLPKGGYGNRDDFSLVDAFFLLTFVFCAIHKICYVEKQHMRLVVKIDNDKPIPANINAGGAPRKYPFRGMAPGESVFFENTSSGGREYMAAKAAQNNLGWKFCARKEGNGIRIWRVS